ncbi:hypothetical protein BGX34_001297 [Mortierella sp. NVP85]|nr:hypothetical protein BGX34_001297 [Mortierella sp. NVP85]
MISSTGTLDVSALSLILQQAIEAAVEKVIEAAVEKAIAKTTANNHGGAIATPPESLSSSSSQDATRAVRAPKGGSSGSQKSQEGVKLEERIPAEIWQRIFLFLYPSQLSRVSMVCRGFNDIISKLSVWPEIYAKAHPDKKNHVVGGVKPVVGKYPPKDFMLYLCAESLQICELCFGVYVGSEVAKDVLAYLTLPVQVWRVRATSKKAEFLPYLNGQPKGWTIRLCLPCRRKIFAHCPETTPETALQIRPARDLAKIYSLSVGDVCGYGATPNPDAQFREEAILARSRTRYGGDVGVAAAAQPSSKAIKSMESRLEKICFRLTITDMDV